ncbi:indole-3-acetic acid inducible 29 [Euphorbia peplus]|nr:indole-3-acetic acid inducible 29 [Euphorbia peplus]
MDLHLDLSLSTKFSDDDFAAGKRRKRSFSYSNYDDDQATQPPTLPLFLWSNQQDEDDDDHPKHSDTNSSSSINQNGGDESEGIVGWPPIKYRQRKTLTRNRTVDNGCADCHARVSNSKFVKVKMEGVAIARKIDLTIFNSFQHLKDVLIPMFGIFQENSSSYQLIYQDKEGDWMLADDNVSWRSFMGSVQRLKLIRSRSG